MPLGKNTTSPTANRIKIVHGLAVLRVMRWNMTAIPHPMTSEQSIPSADRGNVGEVFAAFLKLGLTAFGGPIAHLGQQVGTVRMCCHPPLHSKRTSVIAIDKIHYHRFINPALEFVILGQFIVLRKIMTSKYKFNCDSV
ncbi:hypothetical protein NHF48_022115 [Sphingomonas sp. H160509]|uniref:hypothetical protein n=1 Tax=Sphingomonas sp. H160509 TaxID=2955313 RepID=UPI002098404B|nr:hypothetical protein [Sphingomonas sp. H160509]MDD1453001.1 hypothetical protein [Sphingomonas sp. H160509]